MGRARNVHIVPAGNKWAVKIEGQKAPVSTHNKQQNAIEAGRPVARREQAELVIHRRDGAIRDSDSYDGDPYPPRDTKH